MLGLEEEAPDTNTTASTLMLMIAKKGFRTRSESFADFGPLQSFHIIVDITK